MNTPTFQDAPGSKIFRKPYPGGARALPENPASPAERSAPEEMLRGVMRHFGDPHGVQWTPGMDAIKCAIKEEEG